MSSNLAEQLVVIPIAVQVLLLAQDAKNAMKKAVNFFPEITEFKVFVRSNS